MGLQAEHKYWIYIMASLTGTLYTGVTGHLYARALQHKALEVEGFSKTYKVSGWFTTRFLTMFSKPSHGKSKLNDGVARKRSRSSRR
jgi:hypothetical protein